MRRSTADRRPTPLRHRRAAALFAGALAVGTAVATAPVAAAAAVELGPASAAAVVGQTTAATLSVLNGSLRSATGSPTPQTGLEAALWSNSSVVTATVTGSGRVLIGGIAQQCQGWPTVRVRVDGSDRYYDTTLKSETSYGSYGVSAALPAGTHKVDIRLTNDLYTAACDRNAFIGSVTIERSGSAATPTTPTRSTPAPSATPTPTTSPSTSAPTTPTPTTPTPTPAAPSNPTGGVAGPSNTGVPDGTKLTRHEGDLSITKDGTVIDSMEITGSVKVNANNVTIRNSIIRGGTAGRANAGMVAAWGPQTGLLIEDTTLAASDPSYWLDGVSGHDYTLRRVDVSGAVDNVKVINGGNVTVVDSWLHDNMHWDPDPTASDGKSHDDSIQIQGHSNVLVQGNTIEGAYNAAIMVTQDQARTSNVRILDNHLSGGGCTVNLSEKGKGPLLGFAIRDNTFGTSRLANCPIISPTTTVLAVSGNVWAATGQTAEVRKGS